MIIYSNLYNENKKYDTSTDLKDIKRIINTVIASQRNIIASTGTLIKKREVVKFKDGSWFKSSLFVTKEQMKETINKIKPLNILKIEDDIAIIKNLIGEEKRYLITESEDFKRLISVLEFMGAIEITNVYDIDGVSTDRNTYCGSRILEKRYFFEGEEVELIEWAAKNKIWHWLKEVES